MTMMSGNGSSGTPGTRSAKRASPAVTLATRAGLSSAESTAANVLSTFGSLKRYQLVPLLPFDGPGMFEVHHRLHELEADGSLSVGVWANRATWKLPDGPSWPNSTPAFSGVTVTWKPAACHSLCKICAVRRRRLLL